MKNFKIILLAIIITLPKSAFGIAGFGLKFIQDGTKLGASSYTEGSGLSAVTVESYEMENPPVGAGGYLFIDLAGWALELEQNLVVRDYKFSFLNQINQMENVEFGWARASRAITVKKNIADFSIPFLAKTAFSAGIGINSHSSTPRASVSMVKELLDTDDLTASFDASSLEDKLIKYLKENKIDNSGIHFQLGLRFKVLVVDLHLDYRYNISENVYDGEDGFGEIQAKLGMGF
tara:strand:+ start:333 stop:1034 length:702 start_codon:yes stop_codon:yes gene_type:complete